MKTKKIIRKLRREAEFWRQSFNPETAEILQVASNRLEMLSVELKHLNAKLQRTTEERDAAVEQIRVCARDGLDPCTLCLHGSDPEFSAECQFECATCDHQCSCRGCGNCENWEWRGLTDKKEEV